MIRDFFIPQTQAVDATTTRHNTRISRPVVDDDPINQHIINIMSADLNATHSLGLGSVTATHTDFDTNTAPHIIINLSPEESSAAITPTSIPAGRPAPLPHPLHSIPARLNTPITFTKDLFAVNTQAASALTMNLIRDVNWSWVSSHDFNYRFSPTTTFIQQCLAQQLWPSIIVLLCAPLVAYIWSKAYDEEYKVTLTYALIASVSALAAIIPWNYSNLLGVYLFSQLGYSQTASNYLGSVFPGPGFAEGPIQTIVTNGLSAYFDPHFKYDGVAAFLGVCPPIPFLAGDLWQLIFLSLAPAAAASTAGVVAQAACVGLGVCAANYATIKINGALNAPVRQFFSYAFSKVSNVYSKLSGIFWGNGSSDNPIANTFVMPSIGIENGRDIETGREMIENVSTRVCNTIEASHIISLQRLGSPIHTQSNLPTADRPEIMIEIPTINFAS